METASDIGEPAACGCQKTVFSISDLQEVIECGKTSRLRTPKIISLPNALKQASSQLKLFLMCRGAGCLRFLSSEAKRCSKIAFVVCFSVRLIKLIFSALRWETE